MVVNYGEGAAKARQRLAAKSYKDDAGLDKLPIASDAAFDMYNSTEDKVQGFLTQSSDRPGTCLEGTRVDLEGQIFSWGRRQESTTIFWLEGQAGTGKPTFARTIAYNFQDTNQLVASFFFKQGESDRSSARKLFPTLARQLAHSLPEYKRPLLQELKTQPDITSKSLKQQFEVLFFTSTSSTWES